MDAEAAYEAIAPVYDEFTAHYDTEAWLSELLPQLEHRGLSGGRLLDVGCGTGESFIPMLRRGWEITGCDISAAMLERAKAKVDDAVQLRVADMRELPRFGSFDLVWALDDAVNYLLSTGELEAALSGMRGNLAPGGLMMFDLNTLLAYRTFGAERHVVESGDQRFVWTGLAASNIAPGSICDARFETQGESKNGVNAHLHRQRHFPEADALAALASVDLECLEIFGHGLDGRLEQPLDEAEHTKAVYISRSAETSARSS